MKTIFSFFVALLVTLATTAQTFDLEGKIQGVKAGVTVKVFEYEPENNNWQEIDRFRASTAYDIALRKDKSYQVWFTDRQGFTKIFAVNSETVEDHFMYQVNIDFRENESAQLVRDERGNYALTLIDTDFCILRTPFDLYKL